MGRIFLVILLATFAYADDFVQLYLTKGINAVEVALQKSSMSQHYWEETLGDKNVTLGYYQNLDTLLIANKDQKKLQVYKIQNQTPTLVSTYNVIVGKDGDKQKEGDLITPLGVYHVVKKFTPADPFYGPLAYALSYPNTLDKVEGKNGYGIWIHGSPMDGSSREPMSKGCIVMKNDTLLSIQKVINPKKATILVGQESVTPTNTKEISALLAQIFAWRQSWQESDLDKYLQFYASEFKRYDGLSKSAFSKMKKYIFAQKDEKTIEFRDINIAPYPNEEKKKLFRVDFYEVYKTKRHQFRGNKEIFVELQNDKMLILAEK